MDSSPAFSYRVSSVGINMWQHYNILAAKYNATNLGQGAPDYAGCESAKQAAAAIISNSDGAGDQYAPANGNAAMRNAVAYRIGLSHGRKYSADNAIITGGATEAIYCSILGLINPGDEVVVVEPYFDIYLGSIIHAGGIPKFVSLKPPHFALADCEISLRQAISPKTKVLLLNYPHNPTGQVLDEATLKMVESIVVEHNLVLVYDEVYSFQQFEEADGDEKGKGMTTAHPMAVNFEALAQRTIAIGSGGKTFSLTGWKVGWALSPNTALLQAVGVTKRFTLYSGALPLQMGLAAIWGADSQEGEAYVEMHRQELQAKHAFLHDALCTAGFDPLPSKGGYFLLVADRQTPKLLQNNTNTATANDSNDKVAEPMDVQVAVYWAEHIGVSCLPLSCFLSKDPSPQDDVYLRLTIAKKWETLHAARDKLVAYRCRQPLM